MLAFNEQPLIKDLPPGCGANHSATDKFDHMRPWYGNFDIILDHFSRFSQLYTTPHAPFHVLYYKCPC